MEPQSDPSGFSHQFASAPRVQAYCSFLRSRTHSSSKHYKREPGTPTYRNLNPNTCSNSHSGRQHGPHLHLHLPPTHRRPRRLSRLRRFPRMAFRHFCSTSHVSTGSSAPQSKPATGSHTAAAASTPSPIVDVASDTALRWSGWFGGGLVQGSHYWRFEASGIGTRFVHGEDYKGWLAFLFWEWSPIVWLEVKGV